MDLTCYLHPGWAPLIRPAPATRPWMDDTPEAFAYRCLPLNIANAHGWEVLSPCGVEASWDGGRGTDAVSIRPDPGASAGLAPVSIFGQGVLTFHVEGLFRTPPGFDLWVGGSPNRFKDALAPLTGVVETDWSPFTFTMNWRFTRPCAPVRFETGEPMAFFFPVERGALERFQPRYLPMDADPTLRERFDGWSASRDAFQRRVAERPPPRPSERWQKFYYQGTDAAGTPLGEDHRTKLRLKPFDAAATPRVIRPPPDDAGLPRDAPSPPAPSAAEGALADRDRLLQALERQRGASRAAAGLVRRGRIGVEAFLDTYYAPARPVVLTGEMRGWPALSPPLDAERLEALGPEAAVAVLASGLGRLAVLGPDVGGARPQVRVDPAGAFAPLRQIRRNALLAQLSGRRRFKLSPPADTGRLQPFADGLGQAADLEDAEALRVWRERLAGVQVYTVGLDAGEVLFAPLGWWVQARGDGPSAGADYDRLPWDSEAER